MSRGQNLSGNIGRLDARRSLPSMKRIYVEVEPLFVSHITQAWLACHQQLASAQLILFRYNFMRAKIRCTLNSDMCIATQFTKTF